MPFIDQSKCISCGACVETCPVGAIFMKDGKAVIDQSKCIHCGKCLNVCPQEAIRPNSENQTLRGENIGSGLGRGLGLGRGKGGGFGRGGGRGRGRR